MIQKPPGVEDIFPDRIDRWNRVTEAARENFRRFNCREIIVPVMEFTEVFARGLGDETDIVSKEMFTFEDRGGRSLTLRPEGTASVVRAYVENGEYNRLSSCKLFYIGPMFRAERPQKGRLRQFNQFGAEFFGSADPWTDFESIAVMDGIAREVGIDDYRLLINSIGCPECRPAFIKELTGYYSKHQGTLCEDCRKRLGKNPLRLLDCKVDSCVTLKKDAPLLTSFLCGGCADHHAALKGHLDSGGVTYHEEPLLVRGLDYYTRTTFEFVTGDAAQNAFAAGGRYDNLVELFGGKPTPAVGFAAGIERMLLLLENKDIPRRGLDAYVVHSGGDAFTAARALVSELRLAGISADLEPGTKGFKSQFKKADREGARTVIIIGDEELIAGACSIKELSTGIQESVPRSEVVSRVAAIVRA